MEPTNHQFGKENDLPNLQGIMFQPLIFRGVKEREVMVLCFVCVFFSGDWKNTWRELKEFLFQRVGFFLGGFCVK